MKAAMTIDYVKLAEAVVDALHTFLLDLGMRPTMTAPQKAEMVVAIAQLVEQQITNPPPLNPPEVPPGGMH